MFKRNNISRPNFCTEFGIYRDSCDICNQNYVNNIMFKDFIQSLKVLKNEKLLVPNQLIENSIFNSKQKDQQTFMIFANDNYNLKMIIFSL
jgi:hypothetical protein